ncbi:hypothetical protein [Novosphingobium capsulatum]|uniref:hypothetical protein n=1 Tax=Novosphingobium capsulatum TaxID=13688 RepID=UPI000786DE8A|nr:hypothetical protein [Novosphingobium capsulatum]WQD92787.1 hypothetical protein U0041_17660 [Novosphingobium capsulatum]
MRKDQKFQRFTHADVRKLTCSVAEGVAKTGINARITLEPTGQIVIVMGANVEQDEENEWADLE